MKKSSPAWTLTARKVDKIDTSQPPGPGAYNPQESSLETFPQCWSASKSPRLPKEGSLSPGPGAYESKYIGSSPPRAT